MSDTAVSRVGQIRCRVVQLWPRAIWHTCGSLAASPEGPAQPPRNQCAYLLRNVGVACTTSKTRHTQAWVCQLPFTKAPNGTRHTHTLAPHVYMYSASNATPTLHQGLRVLHHSSLATHLYPHICPASACCIRHIDLLHRQSPCTSPTYNLHVIPSL